MKIIDDALKEGRTTLTEYESKQVLASYDLPVTRELLVSSMEDLLTAAEHIGYPLVIKGSSAEIAHKTETGLIRVDVRNDEEATLAFREIRAAMNGAGDGAILVQQMIRGQRELVVGLTHDAQFGPCVMFGLGGIFTEILKDVSFRVAPIEKRDALEMMQDIKGRKILDAVRGMPAADLDQLANMLITVGNIGLEHDAVKEIDMNPVILKGADAIAVDALVVLEQ